MMKALIPGRSSHRTRRLWLIALCGIGIFLPLYLRAHGEVPGGGQQNFTNLIEAAHANYRVELMYSPSIPTAGEPTNIMLTLVRVLPEPDLFLGSELPVAVDPEAALVDANTGEVLVAHLPVHPEGEAGVFGVAEYRFPRSGSFVLRFLVRSEVDDEFSVEFPVTVQANAAAFFRLWVNLAVGLLILGLTGMQLWKIRSSGGQSPQMLRPAAIGLVALIVIVFAMDRYVIGAVLDLRKPHPAEEPDSTVMVNEDGSYTITASIQQELGITLVDVKGSMIRESIVAVGRVEERPDLKAIVQAPLWGRIEFAEEPLAVGSRVRRRQPLVNLFLELSAVERGPMEAKDLDIKGTLLRARERMEAALLNHERAQKLLAVNPAYEADLGWAGELADEATAIYEEVARQEETFAGVMKFRDPRKIPVVSPIDGVIVTVDFVPGELNEFDQYRQLFTIVDTSRVWVRASVYITDVWNLRPGQSVRVIPAAGGASTLQGKIHWLGDTLNPVDRTVPVLVDVANEGEVFALGSFAHLEFIKQQRGLLVPEEAVVDTGLLRWVYVAGQEGTFTPRSVEVGGKQDGWWQILSGLEEGDRVVSQGAGLLGALPRREEPVVQSNQSAPKTDSPRAVLAELNP
jgi:RND family efflux transporter MFP subunit